MRVARAFARGDTTPELHEGYLKTARAITGGNGVAMATKGFRSLVNHADVPVLMDMPARPIL